MREKFTLCYIYINSEYSEREVSLNLLNEFVFSVENNKIIARRNPKYIEDLFGANFKSITSIVGENGSGKTSILREVLDIFEEDFSGQYLIVYKLNEQYYRASSFELTSSNDEFVFDLIEGDIQVVFENLGILFYSNIYDLNSVPNKYRRVLDISTKRLSTDSKFDLYARSEIEKQIFFTSLFQKDISLDNYIKIPKKVSYKLNLKDSKQMEFNLDRVHRELRNNEAYLPKNKALFNNIILLILEQSSYNECLKELIYEASIEYVDSTLELMKNAIENVVDVVEYEATDFSNFDSYVKGFYYDDYINSNKNKKIKSLSDFFDAFVESIQNVVSFCTNQVIEYKLDQDTTKGKFNFLGSAYLQFNDAQKLDIDEVMIDATGDIEIIEYEDENEDWDEFEDINEYWDEYEEIDEYDLGIKHSSDEEQQYLIETKEGLLGYDTNVEIDKLVNEYSINENSKNDFYPLENTHWKKEKKGILHDDYYRIKKVKEDYWNEVSILRENINVVNILICKLLHFFTLSDHMINESMIDIDHGKVFEISTKNKSLVEFIKFYSVNNEKNIVLNLPRFFNFYWRNLSSGEHSFLSLFSRFFSIRNDLKTKHLLIIVDEGELYFHPEWQKKWIHTVINIFEKIYSEKYIQLLVTTHSPFILSDLPSENIVLLYSDKSKNSERLSDFNLTFGANIQELFADAFFLRDGLTGNFSKHIINNAINEIFEKSPGEVKASYDYYTKIFSMIGEPIVRRKCVELLNEKMALSKPDIETRITQLEREIEKLREMGKDR